MDKLLRDFFYYAFESQYNEAILERAYILPKDKIVSFLEDIARVPLSKFVEFVRHGRAPVGIDIVDMPQFSSWEDVVHKLCGVMLKSGDSGYRYDEIGRLLLDDGKARNVVAYRKYGEGHAKLGASIGLLQNIEGYFYCSCIGMVWDSLDKNMVKQLLPRLLMRHKLIQYFLQNTCSTEVRYEEIANRMGFSASSIKRRRSNVRCLIRQMCNSDEYDFTDFLSRVRV